MLDERKQKQTNNNNNKHADQQTDHQSLALELHTNLILERYCEQATSYYNTVLREQKMQEGIIVAC